MNIGNEIQRIRKEQDLTQEEFGNIFHVTRQAVSNWENGKTYPDLQILVEISNRFGVSLDSLLKEDAEMVQTIDRERVKGTIRRERTLADMFASAGTGIVVSCLFSPDSIRRSIMIAAGVVMICVGWYKRARYDQKVMQYIEKNE